ncbi:MAG: hypothetical protein LBS05_09480 [Tannerellaceae bacterium]|jgi:hypothetical protein|nr:hypothetical protein [Tannerellaceae bacterium]
MTAKKRQYNGRNTGMFYALMAQLPGYNAGYKDLIKEGVINDFLTKHYGERHGRSLRISTLSDAEYRELLHELNAQVSAGKTNAALQGEAIRKRFTHQILSTLSRIGATVVNGDYTKVNYHIRRIPASGGRILPQISADELPNLLAATRAYCGNIKRQQERERAIAAQN